MTTNFFHPSLLLLFLDPGSGINIPDPQQNACTDTVPLYSTGRGYDLSVFTKVPQCFEVRPVPVKRSGFLSEMRYMNTVHCLPFTKGQYL
jgi:hypothetical protein